MVKGTAAERPIGNIKAEMRAAFLNYADEGGIRRVIGAIDRHLQTDLPQWQIIKMVLEYSVGPATDRASDSANELAERLHELLQPRSATVIDTTSRLTSGD